MTLTRLHTRTIPSLALALATFVPAAHASTDAACGAPSPTLERLGPDYLSLDPERHGAFDGIDRPHAEEHARSPEENRRLVRLLETLRTAPLEGIDGERTRCRGRADTLREIRWRFDLEQLERMTLLDGRTVLAAFEARHAVDIDERGVRFGDDRLVAGTRVAEIVDVPPADAWRPGADGTSLHAVHRFRRIGSASPNCTLGEDARCNRLAEIDTTARAVNRTIEIEQLLYLDGRLSERTLWRLGT